MGQISRVTVELIKFDPPISMDRKTTQVIHYLNKECYYIKLLVAVGTRCILSGTIFEKMKNIANVLCEYKESFCLDS